MRVTLIGQAAFGEAVYRLLLELLPSNTPLTSGRRLYG